MSRSAIEKTRTGAARKPGSDTCLLDRLTDHASDSASPADTLVQTPSRQRDALLRDLSWLLNTCNLESDVDLAPYPQVRRSVINFGICALAGTRMSEVEWEDIEKAIRDAILVFEPRIVVTTLEVRCLSDLVSHIHRNVLQLRIKGDIASADRSIAFSFRSEIDLETGHISLHSQRRA